MAAFVMTHQITSLDNFDLDTSFEDFVRETQHKLLNLPVEQCEEEQVVEDTYDLSSFMAINFEEPTVEKEIPEKIVRKEGHDTLNNAIINALGLEIFGPEELSTSKEKEDIPEQDCAFFVVHQDKLSQEQLECEEKLDPVISSIVTSEPLQVITEPTFTYSDDSFTFTMDGVTVERSGMPSIKSLKKVMTYKQLLRTAAYTRLKKEFEDFKATKKHHAKNRSLIMSGWCSTDLSNPFAKARDEFMDELFDEIMDISCKIENNEYDYLHKKKTKN